MHHTEEEIQEEIKTKNISINEEIDSLIKFSNKNIIKIQYKQSSLARMAIEQGISAFNMSIPNHNIKQEEYRQIKTCIRCYKINMILQANVRKEKSIKFDQNAGTMTMYGETVPIQ